MLLRDQLLQNRPCFGGAIFRFRNRGADHDVGRSGGNRFGWRDHTRLVIGSAPGRAHSKRYHRKVMAKLLTQRGAFAVR